MTRVEEIDLESQPSPSIIKKSEFIEAREVNNKTKGQASSMSGVRPAAQSQGATNGETTGASNNEGYDFQTYMEELIKQKNRKDQEKDTGGGLAPTFLDPRADRFNTPSTKKAQTQPSKRKGKKRNEHVERVLTNIGTGGEKINKLSEYKAFLGTAERPTTIMVFFDGTTSSGERQGWYVGHIVAPARNKPWYGLAYTNKQLREGCNYRVVFDSDCIEAIARNMCRYSTTPVRGHLLRSWVMVEPLD